MASDDRLIFEWEAGRHTFRAQLGTFRNCERFDIRQWYESEPGTLAPTRSGINQPVAFLDELLEAVVMLLRAARGAQATDDLLTEHISVKDAAPRRSRAATQRTRSAA